MDIKSVSSDTASFDTQRASESKDSVVAPITLILDGEAIRTADDASRLVYQLSRSVTVLKQQPSAIYFYSIDSIETNEADITNPSTQRSTIFYLVHPIHASHRSDKPAYFATCTSGKTIGNFVLEPSTSKIPLQRPEFTVRVSVGRTAESDELFADHDTQRVLFTAKPRWSGGRYEWLDPSGNTVALEEAVKSEGTRKLTIKDYMSKPAMDAMVAAWCLRSWYDVAESKEARNDTLERMTPPEAVSGEGMKWTKRTGGMTALGGAGGGM